MASKRDLKKNVNYMIYDIIDECFYIQSYDSSKEEVTDEFIDDIIEFHEQIIFEINRARTKEQFRGIREKLEQTNDEWLNRLNKI